MSSLDKPKVISGEPAVLARRYATALFELAQDKKALEAVESDLRALQEAIDSMPQFRAMATHPRLPMTQVHDAVKKIIAGAKFHELTSAFLNQVTRARRLAYLSLMIEVFKNELAALRKQHVAVVTVPKALTAEQESGLAAQLGVMVGGTVRLVIEEDPALIGGMTIKIGSRLIDASVQGKLARLERQLKTQQEAA